MKQKTLNKKLVINKETVANLSNKELAAVFGGGTAQGPTCEGTVYGRTCDGELMAVLQETVDAACEATAQGRTCEATL